jgi:two-component system, LuxR family, response regulator FixJ
MAASPRPLVALVDDDADLRNALRLLLKSHGVNVTGFASAQDFLTALGQKPFAALLLDVRMPGMTGLELQRQLAEQRVPLPIVLLTGHATVPMAVDALQSGVVDVVEKPFKDERLAEAVKRAVGIHQRMQKNLEDRQVAQERIAELTPRELQVLDLMVEGKPNRQIAQELGISPKTLDIHRANVMHKMKARTTADMARLRILDRTEPRGLMYVGI